MPRYESYRAVAKAVAAAGPPGAAVSPFTIEVRFIGGLTETQQNAFKAAANRWCKVIVGDLPPVTIDGELIDDVLILAQGEDIDGPGQILGQAGPTHLRPAAAGDAAYLPARGLMAFDTADLADMQRAGTLNDVITHEMGHVLGFGTIWTKKKLLKGASSHNPRFVGTAAKHEFGVLRGTAAASVPVENTGGAGTANSHWRETIFRNELMSGFISGPGNPISRVTVASLQDLGYTVDLDAAEPYGLPNLMALADEGEPLVRAAPISTGIVLPSIPMVLPDDSLR